ncbi:DUF5665 domain-containing protein [Paenibacillus sp. HB172176]|uniref:DUF5665 domain-containing protein n=1 Tax=Paenibacillus sp. HB172176 TaxID=2493690 RepID=UPI001F10F417|nr:DUF5665 domain-containing protein [Paenibacillus sp. HB172176]
MRIKVNHKDIRKNDNANDKRNSEPSTNEQNEVRNTLQQVEASLREIAQKMERTQISDYVELMHRPYRLLWRNLLAGLARGVGIAIGFTFFAATILYVLQILGALNLPIIGDYIADIVRIVQIQLEGKTY